MKMNDLSSATLLQPHTEATKYKHISREERSSLSPFLHNLDTIEIHTHPRRDYEATSER